MCSYETVWTILLFGFSFAPHLDNTHLFLSADFGGVRPGQPGRGLPVRSVSLDMNVSPQQPSLQYPIRATSPYTLIQQQQQQGMVGSHGMMANQATMVSTGGFESYLCGHSLW